MLDKLVELMLKSKEGRSILLDFVGNEEDYELCYSCGIVEPVVKTVKEAVLYLAPEDCHPAETVSLCSDCGSEL